MTEETQVEDTTTDQPVAQDHEIYVVVAKYKQINGGQMSFPAKDEAEAETLARAMLSEHDDVEIIKVVAVNRIEEVQADITEEADGQVVVDPSQLN